MSANLDRLLAIMARLRDPAGGCPWDLQQDFATIAPYTIEEAYEVFDAIERGDMSALRDELGDLLFQVVFHARMAEEQGRFDFDGVAAAIADKMVRRHPHVFAAAPTGFSDDSARRANWEDQKAAERAARAAADGIASHGALDGVPLALPALMRAQKLAARAARVGFDWPAAEPVFAKVAEEIEELREEVDGGGSNARLEEEMGDILFAAANLARHLGIDPEKALRGANRKFERRFRAIEKSYRVQGRDIADADLADMEARWQMAKADETAGE